MWFPENILAGATGPKILVLDKRKWKLREERARKTGVQVVRPISTPVLPTHASTLLWHLLVRDQ